MSTRYPRLRTAGENTQQAGQVCDSPRDDIATAGFVAQSSAPQSFSPSETPRVGQISFINCLPIVVPMQSGQITLGNVALTFETPSALNSMFAQNQLDLGAMSSFYYLSRQSDLQLIPAVSIACTGPVGSVMLFSKRPLKDLKSAKILGHAQSATSVNLLRVLFMHEYGFIPELIPDERPDLDQTDADAALVIGDRALEVELDWTARFISVDLGQWWTETQGLPMVFGVWASWRSWAAANNDEFQRISAVHIAARDLGLGSHFPTVLQEAQKRTQLPAARLQKYYRQDLNYQCTEEHLAGLRRYSDMCKQAGLL